MKHIIVLTLCLVACRDPRFYRPEPKQASDELRCYEFVTPVYRDGTLDAHIRRCYDPRINQTWDTVISGKVTHD